MLPRLALTLALAGFLCPPGVLAQSSAASDGIAPAHVAHVEGTASLEREGRTENSPLNMPLLSGDRLKTVDGRVEVLFADGSALHLDQRTTLDVQSDELARLIDGRLRLNLVGALDGAGRAMAGSVNYRVDSPAGSVRLTQPGEYRIALLHGEDEVRLELAVLRGAGEIFTDLGATAVRAGERAYASAGLAPSYAYAYNSASWDAFDRWSESRRTTRLGASAQYLPSEMRTYASTFDEDGDWQYQAQYGYVWYPRVAVGWRPYYYGRWASYPRYGWTWIGADRFAWPTHHYGRWGFSAGLWFWIPAARWAPAYVSWAYAPGYVSWCPLGFDNRPVIAINIFNVRPGYYASSRAWTVIASSHFGRASYVPQRAVSWDRFDRGRHPAFEVGRAAPAYRDVAVPRNSAPIRWAGSRGASIDSVRPNNGAGIRDSSRLPSGSRAGEAGRSAPARDTAVPRYVNRGDEIIRSPTERPTAPRPANGAVSRDDRRDAAAAREGYAVPRTAPAGPARRIEPPPPGAARATGRDDRDRTYAAPDRVQPRGGVQTRPNDDPVYRPRTYEPRAVPRTYEPRSADPRVYEPRPRTPEPRGEGPERGAAPPNAAQPRTGYEPRPAPARAGESRPAPPPRAAPPPDRAAPRETAVPRDGGRAAPAGNAPVRGRGGRGGA